MPLRWGPGPVFVHESVAATRRWQLYALRSLFVLGLLAGLGLTWLLMCIEEGQPVGSVRLSELAQLGEEFYYAISTTQLILVLIVAPAATAGTICLDRARGNLTHMLVTDLGDAEIVLGKLAARLMPVLALVGATVPVLALAGLLGGIIIEAILIQTVITLVVAILGCTLALAISVRATRTHEVLMAVYGIECAYILGPIIWAILASSGVVRGVPQWFAGINPFVLAWAPYAWPTLLSLPWLAGVLGGMMALSAGLTIYSVVRLRAEMRKGTGSHDARLSSWLGRIHARLFSWRPGPSLDKDPVMWREWHRSRPSRLARIVWGTFIVLSIAGTMVGIGKVTDDFRKGRDLLLIVNGLQATFGLLLVSITAPTVLAEERVRGSLDVLLTTPLSTDRIVLAKWWGAYRVVPALALLPAIGAVCIAALAPTLFSGMTRFAQPPTPLDIADRIAYVTLPMGMLLAQGAVVASVGVALATWSRRIGRAVAVSVTCFAVVSFVSPILLEIGPDLLIGLGFLEPNDHVSAEFVVYILGTACPFGGQCFTFETVAWPAEMSRGAFYIGQLILLLATLAFALILLAVTMGTFNRCVGRASERPRRAPRLPDRMARPPRLHVRPADARPPAAVEPALGTGL
jgi:ABC-type transport system involved in multi-copper enzyme maturation permease subunit